MKNATKTKVEPDPVNQPNGQLVPYRDRESIGLKAQLNAYKEFVASSLWNPYLDLIRSLPRWSDDIELDYGLDAYDKMDNDPVVSAGLDTIVFSCLENKVMILPAVDAGLTATQDEQEEAKQALEVAQFVEAAIAGMEIPLGDVLQSMIRDSLKYGWKLGEITLENAVYNGQPALFARCLDPKPRQVYRLVVDRNNRLLCILAIIPGVGVAIPEGIVPEPEGWPNTVTPEKFMLLTMPGKDRSPQGRSRLRCVWNPWWLKWQTWPQLLQWLFQIAGGFIWAETPEETTLDPSQPDATAEDITAQRVAGIRNGVVVALRMGGQIHVERPEGDGNQFWTSIDGFDRQILTGILTQAKSHKEAEKDSKANVSASTDLTDTVIGRVRSLVCGSVERSLFHLLVKLQFGDEMAKKYTPRLSLDGVPQSDWAKDLSAAASAGFTVEDSVTNKAEVAERLNLTPDLTAYQEAHDRKAASMYAETQAMANPNEPAKEGDAKKPKQDIKNLALYQMMYARAQMIRNKFRSGL